MTWETKPLAELCEFENGDRGENYPGRAAFVSEGVPIINAGHLRSTGIDTSDMNHITRERFDLLRSGKIKRGDILFCLRGSLGKFAYNDCYDEGAIASSLIIIRPTDLLDTRYLCAYLGSSLCADMIDKYKNGAAQPNLGGKSLEKFLIPIPPLEEQRRIVALLDEAFAGLDTAIANTEKNLANARELFENYLNSVFADADVGWSVKNFGDADILSINDGDRGKHYPKKAEFSPEGFCLFLNTGNVREDGFDFSQTAFVSKEKDSLLRKGKLERWDVVLTTRGTLGNVAIYDESVQFEDVRINSGMLILRPNQSVLLPDYLFEFVRSGFMKDQIRRLSSGAAQPQLPIKTLINFTFPFPNSLEEQKKIVSLLRVMEGQINELTKTYSSKLTTLQTLKQSILQRAFSGALTAPPTREIEAAAA